MIVPDTSVIELGLDPDNPCNTTITNSQTGKVIYTVKTYNDEKRTVTEIKNAAGDFLASAEWRDIRSDIITLGGFAPMPSSAWLWKSMIPFKDTVYFKFSGKDYKWKGNGPGMSLELYAKEDKSQPIARFIPSKRVRNPVKPDSRSIIPAYLAVDTRAEDIMDIIVISWCFLEKSRRAREGSTLNRANALGTPTAPLVLNLTSGKFS